jgi:hypothetical protein
MYLYVFIYAFHVVMKVHELRLNKQLLAWMLAIKLSSLNNEMYAALISAICRCSERTMWSWWCNCPIDY